MKKPTDFKTTALGIATILTVLSAAAVAFFDGDPATNFDIATVVAGITAGFGLIFAKDADKKVEP
jgi:hypothetical protein